VTYKISAPLEEQRFEANIEFVGPKHRERRAYTDGGPLGARDGPLTSTATEKPGLARAIHCWEKSARSRGRDGERDAGQPLTRRESWSGRNGLHWFTLCAHLVEVLMLVPDCEESSP
jgi:hypothetical protein